MTTNDSKTVHSLIIDSGPIIKNIPSVSTLLGVAEVVYTIPSVIKEIRDASSRLRLENSLIPFLVVRSPRPMSVKIVQDFAQKTGDLEALSRPDINLMALAYELECERNHGDWRLRSVPGQKRLNGAPPASIKEKKTPPLDKACLVPTLSCSEGMSVAQPACIQDKASIPKTSSTVVSLELQQALGDLNISEVKFATNEDDKSTIFETNSGVPTPKSNSLPENVFGSDDEVSDKEGWITFSNLKQKLEDDGSSVTSPIESTKRMQVALITTDFAMQNVLLRMNLNILSLSLRQISNVKNWVLRCHACFQLTKDMTKQFCGCCGKPTLLRTSCTTNKDGKVKLHLKKNMQWNSRGNIYSIPKPRPGTSSGKLMAGSKKGEWGKPIILAEDQKEYVRLQAIERRHKDKSLMDEDYLPDPFLGHRKARARPTIGAGKNINSRKKR